jgi:hypothetical protein
MMLAARASCLLLAVSLLAMSGLVTLAQPGGMQVKGTVAEIAGDTLVLAEGSSLQLADQPRVTQIWSGAPGDLAPGQFLSISARRLADGTLDASLIGVFPEGTRPGESQRELAEFRFCEPNCEPGDLMTNAAIEEARVETVQAGELTISFLDQTSVVRITAATRIEFQQPGSLDDMTPGSEVLGFVNPQGLTALVWVYMG